ncbi:MAG: hypothetical protein IJ496_10440 [Ruminococcus sp.]|nr:hypothetical protein [Ruminococcus sp.]
MKDIYRNLAVICVMAALLAGLSLWSWLREPDAYSSGERRLLAQFPEWSVQSLADGRFMEDFEEYAADQFPLREQFRALKAFSSMKVFRQLDNDGLYEYGGHLSRMDTTLNEPMLEHAAERFQYLYDAYLSGGEMNLYFSIIPDKNNYLAEESGRLSLDYEQLVETMREKTGYMTYIDVSGLLEADDYYRTDTHWKQEKILDVAEALAGVMGAEAGGEYTVNELDIPFYGVYSGQAAWETEPDIIRYLTSAALDECIVTSYSTGAAQESVLYNREKAGGKDPYEFFLSGSEPLLTIENPLAETDRELILFRDSFGSSLAPLLVEGYAKITLVDIRYVQSSMLGSFIRFEDQDVLFLYSDTLLNNSLALR